jgi:hypothetical protein
VDWKPAPSVGMPEMDAQRQTLANVLHSAETAVTTQQRLSDAPGLPAVHAFAEADMTARTLGN